MLCDIGIYPPPVQTVQFDNRMVGPDTDLTTRERLSRRGVDVDHTPVDKFMDRPDWGFASLEDED